MQHHKLIIIGGGPAGLSAAVYASRAQLSPLVIEGSPAGGQLLLTTEVENYPGFPDGILGVQLVQNIRKQAEKFGTTLLTENVDSVEKLTDGAIKIKTQENKEFVTQVVLVATGANAKWLGIPSEEKYRGKGVSACATCDGFFFKNKVVAVIGGGDTAMEEASFLTKFATKVYLIHRRDEFRASRFMQERVKSNAKIEITMNTIVEEILGDQIVKSLKLKNTQTSKVTDLPVDGIFIAIGHEPATKFLQNSGVWLDENGYIKTIERTLFEEESIPDNIFENDKAENKFRYATNIPGIFAAGDRTDPHYRQAATAVGMAVAAEIEIEKYLSSIK